MGCDISHEYGGESRSVEPKPEGEGADALGTGHIQPECDPITEWKKNESDCLREIQQRRNETTGCQVLWDELLCWPDANPGQTLTFDCPGVIVHFTKKRGWVKRNCTTQGWTDPSPPYAVACPLEEEIIRDGETETEHVIANKLDTVQNFVEFYLATVKTIYTIGYSVSTATLTIAVVVLISFRRLHCPRNYIHIHLFLTFILKAIAIFVRDLVVFQTEGTDYCSFSTSQCKISVVFSHYFMMTNFMWLLVEALYLNCLLLSSFPHGRRYFWWLVLFGWGVPTFFTTVWILVKVHFEDTACWDITDNSPYWWLIKGPIIFSVAVNFGLFINIIRILLKKLDPRRMNFSHSSQYR
uniref:Uncharacterized protein n=1 Tax=Sphaerodactylus townsendi TaxID=933632 RepID=A0ACB8FVV3_9SAUR